MIIDARTLADGATLEADVCIAGAGAAGMTIALDLRASDCPSCCSRVAAPNGIRRCNRCPRVG